MHVLGTVLLPPTLQFRSRHTSDMADVSPTTNVKTSFPRPQHEGRLRSSCVVTASSQANSLARHIGTFRCIFDDSTGDTLWTTSTIHSTTCSTGVVNLLHVALPNALQRGQSHDFNDLLFDLRAYSIVACLASGHNHRRSPFSSASVTFQT